MDLEGSLQCTQESARYPYAEAEYFCHALLSCLFKVHFNIILTPTHVCFKWSFIFQTSHTKSVCICFLLHMRQMLHCINLFYLFTVVYLLKGTNIAKISITHVSAVFTFVPHLLQPKYISQQRMLEILTSLVV
jgi:hypothetical protein